jgi:hypothetical protein
MGLQTEVLVVITTRARVPFVKTPGGLPHLGMRSPVLTSVTGTKRKAESGSSTMPAMGLELVCRDEERDGELS